MVTELSKRIKFSEDPFDLASYFPTLLWIIRDFHLELVDEYGLPITHDEYLENALKETVGYSKDVMERNKIRSLLKTFFKERHCFTLVRPAHSENDLQNLSTAKSKTRMQFEQQITELKKLIFESLKSKAVNGVAITGKVFLNLTRKIISSLNTGAVY
jgi:hypothetical protein